MTAPTSGALAVEEANQLLALPVGEPADRLRLADPALVEQARSLHATELRHGHQHVEDLRSRDELRRVAQDLLDRHGPGLEVLLELRALDANVVRSSERLHALVKRTNWSLHLRRGRHHERAILTTSRRGASSIGWTSLPLGQLFRAQCRRRRRGTRNRYARAQPQARRARVAVRRCLRT